MSDRRGWKEKLKWYSLCHTWELHSHLVVEERKEIADTTETSRLNKLKINTRRRYMCFEMSIVKTNKKYPSRVNTTKSFLRTVIIIVTTIVNKY